jgi:hypothetical protein
MRIEPQPQEPKEDEVIYLSLYALAGVPEPFHPLIQELIKQGMVKIICDGPREIM